jgi:tetratricopeptide (TPR) repeat protein
MRVARYFPILVAAGLLCHIALPGSTRAWDNPVYESADQSQTNNRIVDDSVRQAGYYDSRPGPTTSDRSGPLFRGQQMHFPSLLFGRPKPKQPSDQNSSQSDSGQATTKNGVQPRQRMANPGQANGRPMQQRSMNAMSPSSGNTNYQNGRNMRSRPPEPIYQATVPHPTTMPNARANPAGANGNNRASASPWGRPQVAAAAVPVAAAGSAAAIAGSTAKPVAAPLSPADRLIAEAHQLSTTARSEEEYTRIIETCRRAQASHASAESTKYASTLIAWAFNRRGQLKAEAGRDKDAIADFDAAVQADGKCWRAIHNRGVLLAQSGQFERAFDDFTRTVQLNSQFAKAYSNRAALFMVANNLNAAMQDYNMAIELDSNLAVAHRGCGRVCQLLGRLDEANEHYDIAVNLAPNDAFAASCRADLLTDLGRYSDALSEYNRALELDPKLSQANCGSAWLLATCPDNSLRNPTLAAERAKKAIELGSQKDALSFDSLAAAQASAGDFKAALQSIHKAIELAPADERDSYKERLALYQKAKPYRIAPVERVAQQASYQTK